ncbi:hypothetical protein [Paenibacillus graminis]|uniref:hypothetical protein n=1 Tax=Paenibacillus graminis TaxID=189425 RepID=UPI000FC2725C|nr:hypothetical protein [Paenibacillus graminis]MEC0167081.1 hypothetical protein [Paenibacillus graminis]
MDERPELEYATKIERLLKMQPKEIQDIKVKELVNAIHNKDIAEADVLQFTNITPEQLHSLVSKNDGKMN